MYHLRLQQFPHSAVRFNLERAELVELLAPWVRDRLIEVSELKWNPATATLTVLEGEKLELQQLSMGRGWRNAERRSRKVTEQVLDELRVADPSAAPSPVAPSTPVLEEASDGLAVDQLAALLGETPLSLLGFWRQVASTSAGLRPSETLAIAERRLAEARRDDEPQP